MESTCFDEGEAAATVGDVVVDTTALFKLAAIAEKLLALMTFEAEFIAIDAFGPTDFNTGIAPTWFIPPVTIDEGTTPR